MPFGYLNFVHQHMLDIVLTTILSTDLYHDTRRAGRVPQHEIARHANNSFHRRGPLINGMFEADHVPDLYAPSTPISLAQQEEVTCRVQGRVHGDAFGLAEGEEVLEPYVAGEADCGGIDEVLEWPVDDGPAC